MLGLGALAFAAPWLLLGLVALPVLWWLLRAVPPSPAKRAFPGVRLLLGLKDPERMPERTPLWLLLLRIAAVAAAILAFAEPVLNPSGRAAGSGPLLVLADAGWASAPEWEARRARMQEILDQAGRAGRPVALHRLSVPPPGDGLTFADAAAAASRLPALEPEPLFPDRGGFATWLEASAEDRFDTLWLTDGIARPGDAALIAALRARGGVTLVEGEAMAVGLTPPVFADGRVRVRALRADTGAVPPMSLTAIGPDPQGIERPIGAAALLFEPEAREAEAAFDLPLELRNRITRIALSGARSAGSVVVSDDALKRRKIGLVAGRQAREGLDLVAPLYFLRRALETSAELIEAPLADVITAQPDVIILADLGTIAAAERAALVDWMERGGLLVRFAGPRLAQSEDGKLEVDPLLPVRLRAGGRTVGGAMSWGAPKRLRPFPDESPFFGLTLPGEVDVSTQVMAQPDPELPDRVLAALEDGTPLVTGAPRGEGRVILFHVTANAEWSNLPLSYLFVQMLERLALTTRGGTLDAEAMAGQLWQPEAVLDGFGALVEPGPLAGVEGARLAEGPPAPDMPPGLYAAGERRYALNVLAEEDALDPLDALPSDIRRETLSLAGEVRYRPPLLLFALLLLAADILATLRVTGRLRDFPAGLTGRTAAAGLVLALALAPPPALAQSAPPSGAEADTLARYAANETVLAYVLTGDERLDGVSAAGLSGLSRVLTRRTAIEPVEPMGVDPERDTLSLFPFLYWPISERQATPSDAAYAKLNAYLRSGGMILFDTRDANLGASFGGTPNGRVLRRIAAGLDIPPLEPVPEDHVLTRTFYLLQDFPGRFTGGDLWVEAAPDAETVEGLPFRNLNDGVTPVVIGAHDWAAAWAATAEGVPMFPVGRGAGGAQQRELSYRFGVNLIMHVMTGNYKSDQVHVPALLERLGQ